MFVDGWLKEKPYRDDPPGVARVKPGDPSRGWPQAVDWPRTYPVAFCDVKRTIRRPFRYLEAVAFSFTSATLRRL